MKLLLNLASTPRFLLSVPYCGNSTMPQMKLCFHHIQIRHLVELQGPCVGVALLGAVLVRGEH